MASLSQINKKIVHFWNTYVSRCPDCLKRWNKVHDPECPHCELQKIWIEDRYLQIAE